MDKMQSECKPIRLEERPPNRVECLASKCHDKLLHSAFLVPGGSLRTKCPLEEGDERSQGELVHVIDLDEVTD